MNRRRLRAAGRWMNAVALPRWCWHLACLFVTTSCLVWLAHGWPPPAWTVLKAVITHLPALWKGHDLATLEALVADLSILSAQLLLARCIISTLGVLCHDIARWWYSRSLLDRQTKSTRGRKSTFNAVTLVEASLDRSPDAGNHACDRKGGQVSAPAPLLALPKARQPDIEQMENQQGLPSPFLVQSIEQKQHDHPWKTARCMIIRGTLPAGDDVHADQCAITSYALFAVNYVCQGGVIAA